MGAPDEMTSGNGTVELVIPARPEFVRIARMAAAGFAAAFDVDVEAVDEVRMATDEVCQVLTGGDWDTERSLTLTFSATDGRLSLRGVARPPRAGDSAPPFSEEILRELADDADLGQDGALTVWFNRSNSDG